MADAAIKAQLDGFLKRYNRKDFIPSDPISVPHRFSKKQDIEIAALFSAVLAWGQRTTIIKNLNTLMNQMDNQPFDFIKNHKDKERKRFLGFVHRTFNDTDLLYFIEFLQFHFNQNDSLEGLFLSEILPNESHIGSGLAQFHRLFFQLPHLSRTEKHIATPERNSACKRMNLFLRWMVRYDENKVDFGIWQNIKPSQLLCPLDVHVQRAALKLGILKRTQADWKATLELTEALKQFDADDPVKYDLALFGYSLELGT